MAADSIGRVIWFAALPFLELSQATPSSPVTVLHSRHIISIFPNLLPSLFSNLLVSTRNLSVSVLNEGSTCFEIHYSGFMTIVSQTLREPGQIAGWCIFVSIVVSTS